MTKIELRKWRKSSKADKLTIGRLGYYYYTYNMPCLNFVDNCRDALNVKRSLE